MRRRCLDCPALIPATAYKGRCAACNRKRDGVRGSRQDRGYDLTYDRERRTWQLRIDAGMDVGCWRCGNQITGTSWHLGHDDLDRTILRGPECPSCNLSAAGRASHRGS